MYVEWRLLATDPSAIAFNLYGSTDGGAAVKLNSAPIIATTDFIDLTANPALSNAYFPPQFPIQLGMIAPGATVTADIKFNVVRCSATAV